MTENQRDKGLVRAVGLLAFAAGIFNAIVGTGIFLVPAALFAAVGSYAPFAFLVCAIGMGCVALCLAEGGSRMPTSGGLYGYIEFAFGPLVGYVAGTLLWVGDVLACGGIAAAFADILASLVPPQYAMAVRVTGVIGMLGCITLVNIAGAVHGARLASAAAFVKVLPFAVFLVAGAAALHRIGLNWSAAPNAGGFGRGLLLALFSLTGMEVTLSGSGEVAQPARTIPRALAIALTAVTALYIGVQVVAQGLLGAALAQSPAPLADAMARISPALGWMMLATAAVSIVGWMSSDLLGTPRMLFAFARDGLLPRILGRVHPRTHTPYTAIICYAIIAAALALSGTFARLAVAAALTSAVLYGAGCAAAWVLAQRGVAEAGTPLNSRWLKPAAVIGIGSMLLAIGLAERIEIVALLALVAASAVVYVLSTRLTVVRA